MQVGSIGGFVFECSMEKIRSFTEYSDSFGARIECHDVGGTYPVLEFVGPSVRCIEIPFQLNAYLGVDVEASIAALQKSCKNGELQILQIGGRPIGPAGAQWLIENICAQRRTFDKYGVAITADCTVTLKLARTQSTASSASSVVTKSQTKKVKK